MRKFLFALFLALPLPVQAGAGTLNPISMNPQDSTYGSYVGKGSLISLKINNEAPGHDVDAFPDPLLHVTQLTTNTSCTVMAASGLETICICR